MNDPLEEECQRRREESERDEPCYPGSIDGDPTELDRLREENARLKAAVDEARTLFTTPISDTGFMVRVNNWLAANPEVK